MHGFNGLNGLHGLSGLADWLGPRAQSGIGDFVLFQLVNDYLTDRIDEFGMQLMGRTMTWASSIALVLVTLWILLTGYRIVTGQSREPMMALVANATRIALIVGVATTMSFGGSDLHRYLTYDLDREIHGLFSGRTGKTTAQSIDENLAYTQLAMSAIDAVQIVPGDPELQDRKARAVLFAGVGAASPAMSAGAMLLMFKFSVALFIGLGPLFILCLIFDQTRDLFRRWLMYGIGTLFSMAMLSVVTGMLLELMARVSAALWVAKIGAIWGVDAEGISNQAMQQGGLGLIMTVVIVTVPPFAANFFQGTLGGFMQFSAFGSGAAGQAAGAVGSAPAPNSNELAKTARASSLPESFSDVGTRVSSVATASYGGSQDRIKRG
jgi:type IV secretion system protein VirB6